MTCRTPAGVGSTIVTPCEWRRWVTASKMKRCVVRPVMTVSGTPLGGDSVSNEVEGAHVRAGDDDPLTALVGAAEDCAPLRPASA